MSVNGFYTSFSLKLFKIVVITTDCMYYFYVQKEKYVSWQWWFLFADDENKAVNDDMWFSGVCCCPMWGDKPLKVSLCVEFELKTIQVTGRPLNHWFTLKTS